MAVLDRASIDIGRNHQVTFRDAAHSYLKNGGERRYLDRIIDFFGEEPVATITPYAIRQMATELYPHQSNATRNRSALTPARAVLIHAYDRGWCPLIRLGRLKQEPARRKSPASSAWLQIFVRQCDLDGLSHLGSLVLFMAQSGARVSEAVRLKWEDVDLAGRHVILRVTKTDRNSRRDLTDELVARLYDLAGSERRADRVFRYTSRYSVNERIAAVCARAGITYRSSHACGRHSFATMALHMGADLKTAMDAGGWRSPRVFLETYVHTRRASRQVADLFNTIEFDREF